MNGVLRRCVLSVAAALLIGGCQTTKAMQERASTLAADVGEYRDKQSDRIDKLNADYARTFAQLMQQMRDLSDTQLRQGRDIDAQKIADAMVDDWESKTLREALREAFSATSVRQRQAIESADEAIVTARASYEDQYQKAKLEVAKLDKVHANLRLLAKNEDRLQTISTFATDMAKIYAKLRKEADAAGGAKTTAGNAKS